MTTVAVSVHSSGGAGPHDCSVGGRPAAAAQQHPRHKCDDLTVWSRVYLLVLGDCCLRVDLLVDIQLVSNCPVRVIVGSRSLLKWPRDSNSISSPGACASSLCISTRQRPTGRMYRLPLFPIPVGILEPQLPAHGSARRTFGFALQVPLLRNRNICSS